MGLAVMMNEYIWLNATARIYKTFEVCEEKSYNNETTNEISLSFKFYNNEDAMLIYLQRKKETKALQQLQLPSTFRAIPFTHRFDFFQR